MVQKSFQQSYDDAKDRIKEDIEENEGIDIMEQMLKERREWVNEQRELNNGAIPGEIKGFYEQKQSETPLSPEEEAAKKAEEDDGKGKGKEKKAKEKGKKEKAAKGKKAKGGGDIDRSNIRIGPTETVRLFDEFYETYNEIWTNRDETDNYKQEYDKELAK